MTAKIPNLIKRTYRITKDDEKLVKRNSKKVESESGYIRALIRQGLYETPK